MRKVSNNDILIAICDSEKILKAEVEYGRLKSAEIRKVTLELQVSEADKAPSPLVIHHLRGTWALGAVVR